MIDLFGLLPRALAESKGLVLLMAVVAGLSATRLRRLVWVAVAGWTVLLLIAALTPISPLISRWWIRTDPVDRPVSAVVVLSGGTSEDTTIAGEAMDRLIAGIELARGQPSPILVTTLEETQMTTGPVSSEVDQARIIGMLGGSVEWLQTTLAHSTHDEAVGAMALLSGRGVHRIAVVTSPMHTRRACATFEATGFEVVCVAARLRSISAFALAGPTDRIQAFGAWVYELLGMAEYRVRGWIS